MSQRLKHFYEFSNFRIDLEERLLLHDGKVAPLTPKLYNTLLALVEQNGKVVSKDELLTFSRHQALSRYGGGFLR
jgi:DNA-binding winged helix-turn-helix (wHTH) protein